MTRTVSSIGSRRHPHRPWPGYALLAGLALCLPGHPARAASGAPALRAAYGEFRQQYQQLAPDIPISIHSVRSGARIRTEVFGTVDGPFPEVAQVLERPQGYCEFLPPLFNLKACVHYRKEKQSIIRFYVGGKRYSSLFGTIRILSDLRRLANGGDYLHVQLATVNSKTRRHGYSVDIEIAPMGRKTLARVYTDFNPDRFTRLAVAAYLHTVGGNKIGFTHVAGPDEKRDYVRGMTGIIERNTVRAFMAMQAYLDTLTVAPEHRYDARLRRWFDLTERFPQQLHELSRAEYLSGKRRERAEQLQLQRRLDVRRRVPDEGEP